MIWATVIVILSDFDPRGAELEDLARDAVSGESYCISMESREATSAEIGQTGEFFE